MLFENALGERRPGSDEEGPRHIGADEAGTHAYQVYVLDNGVLSREANRVQLAGVQQLLPSVGDERGHVDVGIDINAVTAEVHEVHRACDQLAGLLSVLGRRRFGLRGPSKHDRNRMCHLVGKLDR